jgi:hypothetical protein
MPAAASSASSCTTSWNVAAISSHSFRVRACRSSLIFTFGSSLKMKRPFSTIVPMHCRAAVMNSGNPVTFG